uniref:Nose resistant to fluoxetine protein 6-like n=1 Tax=Saccoglossus kowalevskii TaxID=10224 RepID=A0ABM0MWL7_SACKO|nr:PREDICTED: nose resistant to fluoxetine protein 6-like [Saccoglossus kowalevskii]
MLTPMFQIVILAAILSCCHGNIMEHVFNALAEDKSPYEDVTPLCLNQTIQFMNDFLVPSSQGPVYARQMYQSAGGLPPDIEFSWNAKDWGNFDLCRDVKPEVNVTDFGGLYCLTYTDSNILTSTVVQLGVCFPDSCTDKDVGTFVVEGFRWLLPWPADVTRPFTSCARGYSLGAGDIVAITICAILLCVIIAGTVYDMVRMRREKSSSAQPVMPSKTKTQDSQELDNHLDTNNSTTNLDIEIDFNESTKCDVCATKCQDIIIGCLMSFSVIAVGRKMMSTTQAKGAIGCLNGIRVISMFWIILYHVVLFLATYYPVLGNIGYVNKVAESWSSIIPRKGDLAVEAFLVLSGLLVTYLTMRQFKRCGGPRHHNWFLFYFHRFWRLTPVYMFVLMLYTTLVIFVSDGPLWNQWIPTQAECEETWWEHLLYINNLYPLPGTTDGCFGWSWYLALDMQLYIISPIFIITFYKYYKEPKYEGGDVLYTKPWYRLPNYLVGVVLGYLFFCLNGKKFKINKILNLFTWACAIAVGLAVVLGVYTSMTDHRVDQWVAVLYETTHRFAFSVAIGWVIFACNTGNGGPVNTLLSWSAWLPLARMNYCAYLIHFVIVLIYDYSLRQLFYYSDMNTAFAFIGILVVTYMAAFVIAMAVELPMIELEKVILPCKRKTS